MSRKYKILVLRFSSMGDILLTTPVLRSLKTKFPDSEIHFVTKKKYKQIIKNNIYVDNIIFLEGSFFEMVSKLRKQNYDFVVDLHKNAKTLFIKLLLYEDCGAKIFTYKKNNLQKFLLINFGFNGMPTSHIVDKYLNPLKRIGVKKDNKGLDFFISDIDLLKEKYKSINKYIVICLGGSFVNKRINLKTVKVIINHILSYSDTNIVLLGGDDIKLENKFSENKRIINLVNKTSLNESAFLLKNSFLVITPDTGLMHLASVFDKTIISLWGCTSPLFGYTPYLVNKSFVLTPLIDKHKPCSKHGKYCRKVSFNCIDKIDSQKLIEIISEEMKLFDKQ